MRARALESPADERLELTRGVRADYAPPVMRLADKVVIVTGGASGIGFAYARRFLAEGARVVIADVADPVAAAEKLDAAGHTLGVRTDVSDAASVRAMVTAAAGRFGRVDVLVNNAAVFAALKPQPFDAIAEDEWDRVMAVNVKGIWNCRPTRTSRASRAPRSCRRARCAATHSPRTSRARSSSSRPRTARS